MDKTKKIEKFFETRKMSLEKNNACVQAKYPNIPEPPKATTQALDPNSFKKPKFQIFSKVGEPIECGSERGLGRVKAREQGLNKENELYA